MSFSATKPCDSRWTLWAASGFGALTRQKAFPQLSLNQYLQILDSVLPLQLQIGRMCLGDVFGGHLSQLVNVDV